MVMDRIFATVVEGVERLGENERWLGWCVRFCLVKESRQID